MYKGKTKDYNYYVYNGKSRVKQTLKSLNIASQACADLSDLFFNEKLDITIDNERIDGIIHECLEQNKFLSKANRLLQLVKALGEGAFVAYKDKEVLKINYLNATNIVILEANGQEVDSVLFWSERPIKNGTEIRINAHILTEDGYVIHNRIYHDDDNGSVVEQELDPTIRTIETKSMIPEFAMLYTPEVNNEDINSPYGISAFANAMDIILSVDRAYDTYDNEVWLGRKRIYIKGNAATFNTNADGSITPIFDATDTVYYQVPGGEKDGLITTDASTLRITEIKNALQGQLNLLTSKMGLGHNYYKFQDGQVYVNTDNVISTNSDVYRKIKKQENIITNAITTLCYAIAKLVGINEEFHISVFYDDSIIEDTEQTRLQALSEYNAKLISKSQYYRDVYKLGDKEAIQFAQQMNQEIITEEITDGTEPIE